MVTRASLSFLITVVQFVLLPGASLAANGSDDWATIEYPEQDQSIPYKLVRVIIQLEEGADPESFEATLNGSGVADRFDYDDYRNRLTATLGSEDGLNIEEESGQNTLETRIQGSTDGTPTEDQDLLGVLCAR